MAQTTRTGRWVPGPAPGACPPFAVDGRPGDGPRRAPTEADRRCRRWTLGLVCLASALLPVNVTAPNVALPRPLARRVVGRAVPPSQSGLASGVNNTARQLGIAAGIAGLGAVLEGRVGGDPAHAGAVIAGLGVVLVVALVRPAGAPSPAR